jgi:hypothetical protein
MRQQVGLGDPDHSFFTAEQFPFEAIADDPLEFGWVDLGRDVNHRAQSRGARDATDCRDIGIWEVGVVHDYLLITEHYVFGQATIGVDVEVIADLFGWHARTL